MKLTTSPKTLAPAGLFLAIAIATTCGNGTPEPKETVSAPAADEPRIRLRLSGYMRGRLEPCGCASGQLGGLPRRVFQLRQDQGYDLLLEGGNVVTDGSPLSVQKLMTALTILSMPQTTYHALGIGPGDLELPIADLTQFLAVLPVPAVSSDLVAENTEDWPILPAIDTTAAGHPVRIASLTLTKPDADGFELLEPAAAWKRALEGAAPEAFRILMVHAGIDTAKAQASLEPRPDLIVAITNEVAEPASSAEMVDGVPLIAPGTRGRMLVDVTLARIQGETKLTRYQVHRLAASETAKGALQDKDAKLILDDHRKQVQLAGIREVMAEQFPTKNGAKYVGSEACADCHEDAYDSWKSTKHAFAWDTLEEAELGTRYGWPVTAYPDCVKCHVVGYEYQSGFINPEQTAHLKGVGCEECHGAGSQHVDSGGEVALELSGVDTCIKCHDFEQSPDFAANYHERWKKIEHY